jgi:prevent-host-death family protein
MAKIKKSAPTFVGIKAFRSDFAKYARQAEQNNQPVIITKRNKPLFVLTPMSEDVYSEKVLEAVAESQADVAAGRTYSAKEVRAELGL